jgi:4-amino-4-deoxy-L-arabinose transferase-like glycosyltransferase
MKKWPIILFIFVLAFTLRLVFIISSDDQIETDEITHDLLAVGLLESGIYAGPEGIPTSYKPPLYPAFLALIYRVFGHNYFFVRLIQAVISSLTVCILYLTADKIYNRLTAIPVGIFSSFYMPFVACSRLLYTETLFTFLLVLIVYLVIVTDRPSIARFCALGFLCALATLVKSIALFLPFIIISYIAIRTRKDLISSNRIIAASVILLLCFGSVLLPWSIRNYNVHGKFVLVSTNTGVNLYQGVSRSPGKIFNPGEGGEATWKQVHAISNETEKSDFFVREAFNIYRTRPLFALKMLAIRFLFLWNVIDWEVLGGDVVNYHYMFILPFAFLGTFFALKDKKEISLILVVAAYFIVPVLLFPGTPRYRMPIDGYIIMLGCYGIYALVQRQKEKAVPILCTGFYFLCTYLLYKHSLQTKAFIKGLMEMIGLW